MVKTWYTGKERRHLAKVGPMGPNGKEIHTIHVYEDVMPATHFSQKDYALDVLIDGLDQV